MTDRPKKGTFFIDASLFENIVDEQRAAHADVWRAFFVARDRLRVTFKSRSIGIGDPDQPMAKIKAFVTFESSEPDEPPAIAEFLLGLLLRKENGEGIIGDLSELFERDRQRFGADRARRLYWGRTLKSLWPLLRRTIARGVKWGVVIEAVRRFF